MAMVLRMLITAAVGASIWLGAVTTASARVETELPTLQLLHTQHPVHLLAPDAPFTAQVRGVPQEPWGLCLGLASLRDPYAIPVSLGTFQPDSTGTLTLQATVPPQLFPAESPGPFLLYVGRCTSVAPDGDYVDTVIPIIPAAG